MANLHSDNLSIAAVKLFSFPSSQTPDSPIINIGQKWRLTSPLDAWNYLSPFVTNGQLDKLKECFFVVCREIKPALSLDADKRYMASFYGKTPDFSTSLRKGLCHSLILIGVFGDNYRMPFQLSPQTWVDQIIEELLSDHNSTLWKSLDDILPSIAEASPNSFLSALENILKRTPNVLARVFEEDPSPFFSNFYHTGLLWALEGLAWLPEYLSRVTILLMELNAIDPGIKIMNTPLNSVRLIYLSWLPQTSANLRERMEAILALREYKEEMAFKLCSSLFPSNHPGHASMNQQMIWRTPGFEVSGSTFSDRELFETFILDTCFSVCNNEPEQIKELIIHYASFGPPDREKILNYLALVFAGVKDPEQIIASELRSLLHKVNSSRKYYSGISQKELARLNKIFNDLKPSKKVNALKWIFDVQWPEFEDGFQRNKVPYGERDKYIQNKRDEAIEQIFHESSFAEFFDLLKIVKFPHIFGFSAGILQLSKKELDQFLQILDSEDPNSQEAVKNLVRRKYILNGYDYSMKLFKESKSTLNVPGQSNFLLALPNSKRLWTFILKQHEELQTSYWRSCNHFYCEDDSESREILLRQLFKVERYLSAVQFIYANKESFVTEKIMLALEKAGTEKSAETGSLDTHIITYLFKELYERQDCDFSKLSILEWIYLDFLTGHTKTVEPQILKKELLTNPISFVEMLCFIYPPNGESDLEEEELGKLSEELISARAMKAYKLLDSLSGVPGLSIESDGSLEFNEQVFTGWVKDVRELSSERDRLGKADLFIGKILALYPENPENWPPEAIARIIEKTDSDNLRLNFRIGISNKRSFSSRGPYSGGQRERNFAVYFRKLAASQKIKFPITASILEDLATGYDLDAKREDNEALENDLDY